MTYPVLFGMIGETAGLPLSHDRSPKELFAHDYRFPHPLYRIMTEFVIEIAEMVLQVQGMFDSTPAYFGRYLSEKPPEYSVTVTPENLAFEQHALDEEADREGMKRRVFTPPFLERAAIQRYAAAVALSRNTILLHGSTVAVDGRGYLFTAPCGVGKSTHTRLWRQLLGDRAVMVNDDRAFLKIQPGEVLAYGSPWSGKHGLDSNICVPLDGICILERGIENRIVPLPPEDALPFLMTQVYTSNESALTAQLAETVPLWKLSCNKDISAAQTAFAAMSGRELI